MTKDSDSLFDRMYQHIIVLLVLNTNEQMLTWQYILVVYCQLEAFALELLRLHRGEDEQTFWGKDRLPSLNSAANDLRKHHLAPEEIIQILKKVAALRNSIAHKQLLYGMTTYASYNDKPVFDSDYAKKLFSSSGVPVSGVNEETIELLLKEVDRAKTVLNRLRQEMALKQHP